MTNNPGVPDDAGKSELNDFEHGEDNFFPPDILEGKSEATEEDIESFDFQTAENGEPTISDLPLSASLFSSSPVAPPRTEIPKNTVMDGAKTAVPEKIQAQKEQPQKPGGSKKKDGNHGWVVWIILALLIGGTIVWSKNRNASEGTPTMKSEQVAEVLDNVGATPAANTSANGMGDNSSPLAQNNSNNSQYQGPIAAPAPAASAPDNNAIPKSGARQENGAAGTAPHRSSFSAQIWAKLENLKVQLETVRASYERQTVAADKTNEALENLKQELLVVRDQGDIQAEQASIAEFQGEMASLNGAAAFVNLGNAQIMSTLSAIRAKLDDLRTLVAAYNAG